MKHLVLLFFITFITNANALSSDTNYIEIQTNHFLSPSPLGSTLFSDYAFLKANYSMKYNFGPIHAYAHFLGERSVDGSDLTYYNIPEAFIAYQHDFSSPTYGIQAINVFVGRKAHSWSFSDDYWEFGLWNPLNRWNPLRPSANGLIGSFLTLQGLNWAIEMLVGGMFLPSTSADINFQDGSAISSKSRWGQFIPNKVNILGTTLDIKYYNRVDPFLLDVLFQASYIFSFKTWISKRKNIWMKWVAGYKPVNDIYILTNKKESIAVEEKTHIEQKITTVPTKHRIMTSEWGLDYGNLSAIFSFTHMFTKEDIALPQGYSFLYDRGAFTYYSAFLRYNFSMNHYLQLSYVESNFRNLSGGQEATETSTNLSQYKILSGVGVDWYLNLENRKNLTRRINIKYQYSFETEGGFLSAEGLFYLSPKYYMAMTVDILGAKKETDRFLNIFRANDYLGWRIGYAF